MTIKDRARKFVYYDLNKVDFTVRKLKRNIFGDSHYLRLKALENKYVGQRCFIIATGPSLTIEDIEALSGEITFGVNSLCGIFDKTDFRPTYYAIQDKNVYEKLKPLIDKYCNENLIVGVSNTHSLGFKISDIEAHPEWIPFPLNSAYHLGDMIYKNKYYAKFSSNAYSQVYDGYSITHSLIQICGYMGFAEIYLIGCDCNYQRGKTNHIYEYGDSDSEHHDTQYQRMMKGHEIIASISDSLPFKVYNATRGGMLELYPRVKLEDILHEKDCK